MNRDEFLQAQLRDPSNRAHIQATCRTCPYWYATEWSKTDEGAFPFAGVCIRYAPRKPAPHRSVKRDIPYGGPTPSEMWPETSYQEVCGEHPEFSR